MPKKKKSDDTEEAINASESIVAVSSSFSSAKEQIANTWPSCWTLEQKNEFCEKKSLVMYKNRRICGACP
jgi:hypothetical protein